MIKVTVVTNSGRETVFESETTTIRKILESNGANYNVAVTSLGGRTLTTADLDKTIGSLMPPETSEVYLTCLVKADNAVNVSVAGSAIVVTSELKREDLVTMQEYRPKALTRFEGEGAEKQPVFAISVDEGTGSVNKISATFGKRTTEDGKATITLALPADVGDVKKYIEKKLGSALLQISYFENELKAAMEDIVAEKKKIAECITVA